MPKQRITKEMVINAAFEIARDGGIEQVMVKNIADKIGCSVQPIYSYCNNMDGLRQGVVAKVRQFIQEYMAEHIDPDDLFRSTGNSYLRFAKEEPNLFKIFILHERKGISSLDDLYQSEASPHVAEFIADRLKISVPKARQLHLNMLIYTIGIGTIFSVAQPGIAAEEVMAQQEIAYDAFLKYAFGDRGEEV